MSRSMTDDAPMPMFTCSVGGCGNRVAKRGTACGESAGGKRMPAPSATPEQNAAYRRGVCIDCQDAPHSAGRPRCATCHDEQVAVIEPGRKRRAS